MTTDATPMSMPQEPAAPAPTRAGSSHDLWRKVLRVAWLSIGLGIVLEVLLLVLAAYTGTGGRTPKPFISDLAQKVSWSFIVCVGLALGSAAGKARSGLMGLLGLVSAPVAFSLARSLHKGVNQALGVAAAAGGASPFVLAALKAAEYGVLGATLGALTKRKEGASLGTHLGTGAAIGVAFGGLILTVLARAAAKPMGPVDLVAKGINEVLFPIGCSLVLYAAEVMGKRLQA
ncbi:MAG TPA: hypothetical protein VGX68_22455 [Thermoanaerobaculia bacterium]|jgi:hypothetical protein|nr:hypothetical protein [Thermoanaerobaculia bacterium]